MRIKPLLLLLSLLPVAACDQPAAPAPAALPAKGAYRILALGDSYTIGQSVAPDQRWPVQLAHRLRDRGVDAGVPEIIAKTGWTTADLNTAVDQIRPAGPYDLVTLLIGVNDQFRSQGVQESKAMFTMLLDRAIGYAGGKADRVLVMSIPDWGVTPFAENYDRTKVAREIDAMNVWEREMAEARGARYLDITASSRQAASQPVMTAPDKLHPSGLQYAQWAELVDRSLQQQQPAK